MIKIIVAHSANRVIGYKGVIPWKCPEDMKHFKYTTTNHMVVMGRKTWESLGFRPLSNRSNIILSKGYEGVASGLNTHYSSSIEDVLRQYEIYGKNRGQHLYVIGGQQVYQSFLDAGIVDEIIATTIHEDITGDTFFPELDSEIWCLKEINSVGDNFHISTFCKRSDYYTPQGIVKMCPKNKRT